jgi:hypothetical protein
MWENDIPLSRAHPAAKFTTDIIDQVFYVNLEILLARSSPERLLISIWRELEVGSRLAFGAERGNFLA